MGHWEIPGDFLFEIILGLLTGLLARSTQEYVEGVIVFRTLKMQNLFVITRQYFSIPIQQNSLKYKY